MKYRENESMYPLSTLSPNIQQTIFSNITTLNTSTSTTSQHSDTRPHLHAINLVWSLRHIHQPTFTPLYNGDYPFPCISPNLCTILCPGHYTVPSKMSTQPGHSKNGIRLCISKSTLPKSTHPHENPIIHLLQPTCLWTPHPYGSNFPNYTYQKLQSQ